MSEHDRPSGAIPEDFATLEQAGEFWDTHDLADYWALTEAVDFDVKIRRRRLLVVLEPGLATKLGAEAHRRGVSVETLINLWLSDKLGESVA